MIDRRIKFRHIQCFVEIARAASFKKAAKKLSLTQPAISKTVKELEHILDSELMHRNRGGVILTPEGERFLQFAEMSLASLQQGMQGLKEDATAPDEALSIGALPSVAARLIPDVTRRLMENEPRFSLRIQDGPYRFLIDQLIAGDLDLVIGRMGDHRQMRGVTFTLLYRERVSFYVRAGHPLLEAPHLSLIQNWPIVFPSRGSAIRTSVDRFLIENGIGELPHRIETVSGAFGRVYVSDSDAIWIISDGVVTNEVARGTLVRLPFDTDTTLGPIGIMSREDWDMTAPARLFRRALRQSISAVTD